MAETNSTQEKQETQSQEPQLQGGTYEIIRNRMLEHSKGLRDRLDKLNVARKDVFGAIETKLLASERVTTANNCVPRDMIPVGHSNKFIFGYNVFIGLRTETTLADVFAVYEWDENAFTPCPLDLIDDEKFIVDLKNLYKYYRHATFVKFAVIGSHLFMAFRVGKSITDVKTFKWLIQDDSLRYLDNRSDHQYRFPAQHEFEWKRTTQDMHHNGANPHISIEDRVFVETVGGDLTIKIEDNTETGEGIYNTPVENPDQTLSDAEIYYAIVGNVILLKIRPYQEEQFRYIVYNEKIQQAIRIDAIKDACVLLPDDHGLIYPKGYYLQTGEQKHFDTELENMVFEKRIASPNGEDYLYIFYNRNRGDYILLSYNLISQQVQTPILCNGYSIFDNGEMIYFRTDNEPVKHHVIQVWQTPYYGPDFIIEVQQDNALYKIGNKDIVRCMAECNELLNLVSKEDSYANLYVDIAKKAADIRDSYFWVDSEDTHNLAAPLADIKQAAASAIDEYEKVTRTRQNTGKEINRVKSEVQQIIANIDYGSLSEINAFVSRLARLRSMRGQVVSLKDLRYADLGLIESLERVVAEHTEKLSGLTVEFLLKPESLDPYQEKVEKQSEQIPGLAKVAEAKALKEQVVQNGIELEMLTEIVSNLKISDATETTAIIDHISLVYSKLNQVKSALKNKISELAKTEGLAEFNSQFKLIDQSVINFLDICDTPEKCDEYLTKTTVQLETLESKFADFDEFIIQLSDKREEVYNAFESRKVQLVADRNRRATTLMTAAERILKGIKNRAAKFTDVNEINGYFASDLMIERVRETIEQLETLGDTVKAEDILSQLKTLQQDAVRQLKDKQALYENGDNIIRFGDHRFGVNTQPLEGTIIIRDGQPFFHLTGTGFFEPITDEKLLETRKVWGLEVASETPTVYRAEYLAFTLLKHLKSQTCRSDLSDLKLAAIASAPLEEVIPQVQAFMAPRYAEGYVKGVHDHDAAIILKALVDLESNISLLRYPTQARALAAVFWQLWDNGTAKRTLAAKIAGVGQMQKLFGASDIRLSYIAELKMAIGQFVQTSALFDPADVDQAAEYLFNELTHEGEFVASQVAVNIKKTFKDRLAHKQHTDNFTQAIKGIAHDPIATYRLYRDWVLSYLTETDQAADEALVEYADETAALLMDPDAGNRHVINAEITAELDGLVGGHPLISEGKYHLNYCHFITRLNNHANNTVGLFTQYLHRKKELVDLNSDQLRLDEFKPRVLTTFVRNKLIDKVYLPIIGDNLAKQIGSEGQTKRTDRQGLLLLISPPGYGKTTLMEYIANRLGLIFMKINGPALGRRVEALDPTEAPNAAAREELNKLNLAFEMGDNVMIYVDDIQHTNPEFLQKFISLCDAQRRVEGVYKGKAKTYDLRGKRICVVMAGNPYTESGETFRIPDMLSNRADTYNIGDIVGTNYNEFVSSYVENCLTSNPVLGNLATRSQADVYTIMKMAETDQTDQNDGLEFEGNYSVDELNEYVATMKKLNVVREIILKVNQLYIRSAGQADEYRTEPPFLLQGSYRNMNRIAQRILPVMNDEELWTLIFSSYEQDAQTLTTGAESNLLKFRELTGRLTDADKKRWDDIKKTFGRNLLLGDDSEDKIGKVVRQLSAFSAGLDSIKETISDGVTTLADSQKQHEPQRQDEINRPVEIVTDQLKDLGQNMLTQMNQIAELIRTQQQALAQDAQKDQTIQSQETQQSAQMLLSVLEEQFKTMETWLMRVTRTKDGRDKFVSELIGRFETMINGYSQLNNYLKERYHPNEKAAPKKVDVKKKVAKRKAGKKTEG